MFAKYKINILLAIFILFFIIQNIIFIYKDTRPQYTDFHLRRAITFQFFFEGDKIGSDVRSVHFPPLIYLVTQPFFTIFGENQLAARLSLLIFWVIFLIAMFGIGNELEGPWSGFAVMLLSASSPLALNFSRAYFPDFPQMALMALSLYLLLKSDSYKEIRYSLLFGLVLGLAFAFKWSTAFFMFLPVIWFINFYIIKSKRTVALTSFLSIPFLVFSGGYALFYFLMKNNEAVFTPLWYIFYIFFNACPFLLLRYLIKRYEKDSKGAPDYESSDERRIINFFNSMALTCIIASFWFYWGAPGVIDKLKLEDGNLGIPSKYNLMLLLSCLISFFNLAPLFYLIGIIFYFRQSKPTTFLPACFWGFVGASIILLTYKSPISRYYLPIVVFAATLGGYWVGRAGRARLPAFLIILLISLLSIISWTIVPRDCYNPNRANRPNPTFAIIRTNTMSLQNLQYMTKILAVAPPIKMNLESIIREIKFGYSRRTNLLFFDTTPLAVDCSIPPEAFLNYFFINDKNVRFETLHDLEPVSDPPGIRCGITAIKSTAPLVSGEPIYVVIIHFSGETPDRKIELTKGKFAGHICRIKNTVDIGNEKLATILEIDPL